MTNAITSTATPPTTALVYDFLQVPGGAEQVCLHCLTRHPDWQLLTGFINTNAFRAGSLPEGRVDPLGRAWSHPAVQAVATLRRFERHGHLLAPFDRVLFSGVYAPIGVVHRPGHGNFHYCHTLPRFAYDLRDWYLDRAPTWQRPAIRRLARHVRERFENAMGRMDRIAANSETVKGRLRHHLGIDDVQVIYPPVATSEWNWLEQGDFYLSTARLEPYKRVDWIVRTFKTMPRKKLVVASGGSELERLKALADGAPNITFTGWTTREVLRDLVGRCLATVYVARDEDFGMSPVESMAAGKPVIGVAEGGLRETVIHEETGLLLPASSKDDIPALAGAVERLSVEFARGLRQACEARAKRFDARTFDAELERFMRL